MAKCLAAVADGVLLVGRELGGGSAGGVDEEERVVAEPVVAARGVDDAAFDGVPGGQENAALGVSQRQDADESRGAIFVGDGLELAEEEGVVVGVALAGGVQFG